MGGEWPTRTLGAAGVALFDCDHRTPKQSAGGLPYVTIPQMHQGEIDLRSARTISEADFAEWTKKTRPTPGDLVMSRRCNPGETAFVRSGQTFALGQNLVLLRSNNRYMRSDYLRWLARSPEWWAQVEQYRNPGAVFDSLKCADIPKLAFRLPSLSEQAQIADPLSALDDKIELNRRTAETLKATARALFKSWFIDFDPVRAKAEGRSTELPEDVAASFPSQFRDDGLPEGWRISTIGSLFEVVSGNTPSTAEPSFWGGQHAWATPKDLSSLNSPVLLQTDRCLSENGLARATSGLLPSGSLLVSSRAPIGYMAFATEPVAINQGFAGVLRRDLPTAYAWLWFDANMDLVRGNAGGSTFPEISKSVLRMLPMLEPSAPVIGLFNVTAESIIERLVSLARQSRGLEGLRDTLLPKLISGELRIRDAERAVAAA